MVAGLATQASELCELTRSIHTFGSIVGNTSNQDGNEATSQFATLNAGERISFMKEQECGIRELQKQLVQSLSPHGNEGIDTNRMNQLSSLCSQIQDRNQQQIRDLSILVNTFATLSSGQNQQASNPANHNGKSMLTPKAVSAAAAATKSAIISEPTHTMRKQWNATYPLESVKEIETESDDSSMKENNMKSMFSPSNRARTDQRRGQRTPATPIMDSFSSSSSFMTSPRDVNKSNHQSTTPMSRSRSASVSSESHSRGMDGPHMEQEARAPPSHDYQTHMAAFRDDDDMITLDTMSTANILSRSYAQAPQAFSRSQAYSKHHQHHHHQHQHQQSASFRNGSRATPRSSDDVTGRHRGAPPAYFNASGEEKKEEPQDQSNSHTIARTDTSDESIDDDSTNVVATILASDRSESNDRHFHMFRPIQGARPSNPVALELEKSDPHSSSRPTQIFVDTAATSPDQTNLTMDATAMQEGLLSFSLADDAVEDDMTTATPILDRYRLDADDCTIGVKVVPNKRGSSQIHRRSRHTSTSAYEPRPSDEDRRMFQTPHATKSRNSLQRDYATPYTEQVRRTQSLLRNSTGMTPHSLPTTLPGSVSLRKKKPFRTTPHPKKYGGYVNDDSSSVDAENINPNESMDHDAYLYNSESVLMSPIQPVPSKSHGPNHIDFGPAPKRSEKAVRSSKSSMGRRLLSPRSIGKGAFRKVQICGANANGDASGNGNTSTQSGKSESTDVHLRNITQKEYDAAPGVVRSQVQLQDAHDAVGVLMDGIRSGRLGSTMHEIEAYSMLQTMFHDDRKIKSVLMSLCHWRRLLMHHNRDDGIVFEVNMARA